MGNLRSFETTDSELDVVLGAAHPPHAPSGITRQFVSSINSRISFNRGISSGLEFGFGVFFQWNLNSCNIFF